MEVGVNRAADDAGTAADAIVSKATDVGAETIKQLQELVCRRPLTSLLAAMGAGLALSLFIKRR
jgi:hypothetical protein